MNTPTNRAQWSSRSGFILAATGSAVGLGNIWKFPYIAGENGGGAFVLVYVLCIAVIGIPIMMAEVLMGRRGGMNPVNTMENLAVEAGVSPRWRWMGWMGVLTGFVILSYYSVIAGWAVAYLFKSGAGLFVNADATVVGTLFSGFLSDPLPLIGWHTVFMALILIVISRGVKDGIQKANQILMPIFLVLLLILTGYAFNSGAFSQGAAFLLAPDFGSLKAHAILVAMGHAFFTLSLGMGAIMTYGAYLPRGISIVRATLTIAVADTVIALLAGLVIFPLVFANNMESGAGPGLIFQTLPIAFGAMPGGVFFGTLFFLLLVFAAWSSAISILEPIVAWLMEARHMTRHKATMVSGVMAWCLGVGSALSFNVWSGATLLDKTFFDWADHLASNILLPLGGFLMALFVGWVMQAAAAREELGTGDLAYRVWWNVLRYITPVGMVFVLLMSLGIL